MTYLPKPINKNCHFLTKVRICYLEKEIMKFLIITQVPHVQQNGHYYSYAPYIDEMNIWGQFVSHITIVAPCSKAEPTTIDKKYEHPDVKFTAVPAINLLSILSVFKVIVLLPLLLWRIAKSMNQADHIHLRCPGNMGLLGSFVQIAFPSKPKTAKYAGNWDPMAKQPWSYRLQKWILSNTFLTRNMQVLVYGEWPASSANIKPFFTASYSASDVVCAQPKCSEECISFVFVGALVKGKNPMYAIELLQEIQKQGFAARLNMYGEGAERAALEQYIQQNDLAEKVILHGNQNKTEVIKAYQNSHFVILPSQSEGWPKALAEGMFWGCVPLSTAVSCVPTMLDHGNRGLLLHQNLDTDATQILKLWNDPQRLLVLQAAAVDWSRKFTTEYFAEAINNLLRTANGNFETNYQNTTVNEEFSWRVIQLIDSLQAGGAERIAVHYANALAEDISFSGLVVTRLEGPLQKQLNSDVSYLYLKKKHSIDLMALWRLFQFVKKNNINAIQAHGTSYFFAVLLKCFCPRLQLIWHDHYGESEFLNQRPRVILKLVAPFFNGVVVVNQKLKLWCENVLKVSNVLYLPNFATVEVNQDKDTILHGIAGKRILCLANLRPQKNHFLLLKVAQKIQELHPEWTFHLVGKDFKDEYSKSLQQTIRELNLEKNVFLYGSKSDIGAIISQTEIGVLTSKSEGLPVALLEYGLYKKAVVVTNVGEVAAVVQSGQNGFLVTTEDVVGFQNALLELIASADLRRKLGESLAFTVQQSYSKPAVMNKYLQWLQKNKK